MSTVSAAGSATVGVSSADSDTYAVRSVACGRRPAPVGLRSDTMTAAESELERTRRVLAEANATITALEGRIDELIVERGGMLDTARSLRLRAELAELKGELNRAGLLDEQEL
jgi:hypothetical protein